MDPSICSSSDQAKGSQMPRLVNSRDISGLLHKGVVGKGLPICSHGRCRRAISTCRKNAKGLCDIAGNLLFLSPACLEGDDFRALILLFRVVIQIIGGTRASTQARLVNCLRHSTQTQPTGSELRAPLWSLPTKIALGNIGTVAFGHNSQGSM